MKNKKAQQQLHSELKYFGLNPTDWSLEKVQALTYLIRNKVDKDFTLYGKMEFKKKRPTWRSLEVLSL